MSFNAGELVASIRLDGIDQFERDNRRAESAFTRTGDTGTRAGEAMKRALDQGALATSGVVAAGAGLLTSLARTGGAYNTLQQTSRAALSTLVGGAEKANAQMDKLDAFARTSPFSKAVFIEAQQQLIGFGMEASKVIPTMDAIQQAVAATGGSSQQLADVVFVLAQIQAAGKITGQDLLQLGQRGINAADLIGSSLGKTGAQIKEDISNGALSADDAIAALTVGMQEKFGGATANIKQQWVGATDRIKAANREIGASLAEPFISQQGGGLAVVWGNQVADVLRAVLGHAGPVVSILEARMLPAFANVTRVLDQARVVINSWDSSRVESFLDAAADRGPAVAAFAGALVGLTNNALRPMLGPLAVLVPGFGLLGGTIGALALGTEEGRSAVMSLFQAFEPLVPVAGELASVLADGLGAALPLVAGGVEVLADVISPVVQMLASLPTPVLAAAAAFLTMMMTTKALGPGLQVAVDGFKRLGEQMAVQTALARMQGNTSSLAGAFGVAGKAATGLGNALKAAFITNPVGLVLLGVSAAVGLLSAALASQAQEAQEARERTAAYKDTLVESTGAITDKTRELAAAALEARESYLWFESSSVGETAKALGLDLETVTDAMLGNASAMATVNQAIQDGQDKVSSLDLGNFESQVRNNADAAKAAQEQTREMAQAHREAAAAMTDTERSNARMNEALAIARDVSADATERLKALKQALDELNGGTKSQADLTQELNDQVRSLESAFAAVDENGVKLADSLVTASGEIDTTTAAGSALRTQVQGLRDDYLDAMQAAYDAAVANGENGLSMDKAREVAAPYQQALRDAATEAGLAADKVNAFVSAALETPEVVAFTLTDDGTVDAERVKLIDLAQQILATPDGYFDVKNDDVPGLMEALRVLGVKITTLPDGTVKVTKDGQSFAGVESELTRLTKSRTINFYARLNSSGVSGGHKILEPDGRATGGAVVGPGSGTSDSILSWLSNGEHVITAREVQAAGGHAAVESWRQSLLAPKYATGGPVGLQSAAADWFTSAPRQAVNVDWPVSVTASAPTGPGSSPDLIAELRALREDVKALQGALGRPNVSFVNPTSVDVLADAWEAAQIVGADV